MNSIIKIQNLEFSYDLNNSILNIDQLEINKGEKVFLYGPSGGGKTSLLGIITGILEAKNGQIEILGKKFHELKSSERDFIRGRDMGYIFQVFNLIPYLSAYENVLLSCNLNPERKARCKNFEQEALYLLNELGLGDNADRKIGNLSIGQQQRVAVARALLGNPPLIIADEPTSALDLDHQESFLKILFNLCEKNQTTLVFVSHNHLLKSQFDRCINLNEINRVTKNGSH